MYPHHTKHPNKQSSNRLDKALYVLVWTGYILFVTWNIGLIFNQNVRVTSLQVVTTIGKTLFPMAIVLLGGYFALRKRSN